MLRLLMRYLGNNEQLVERLAQSYPIRRAAQMAVALFYRSKSIAAENNLQDFTPEKLRSFIRTFQNNLKQEIEAAKKKSGDKK